MVPVQYIFKKHRNGYCLDNDGLKQYKNQVNHIDLDELDKSHPEQNKTLKGYDPDIGQQPVCHGYVNKGDGKGYQQNIDHFSAVLNYFAQHQQYTHENEQGNRGKHQDKLGIVVHPEPGGKRFDYANQRSKNHLHGNINGYGIVPLKSRGEEEIGNYGAIHGKL